MRPEHLEIVPEDQALLHFTATMVELLGADSLIHGHFGDDRTDLTVRVAGSVTVDPGERLPLALVDNMLHLFDAESGRRI